MSVATTRPCWFERLLGASCYLGFAPLLLRVQGRDRPFLAHHLARGLITVLLFLLLLFLVIAGLGVETYVLRTPELGRSIRGNFEDCLAYFCAAAFLVLSCYWLIGLLLAALGSMRDLPPLGWAGRRRWCVRTALAGNLSVWALVLLLMGATWHADSLAREDLVAAPVYVLIDKPGVEEMIPLKAVKLVAYRLALAARERWGEGSTVVAQLNEQSLRTALGHGRLVVIWSHGAGGFISMPDGHAMPVDPDDPSSAQDGTRCIYFQPREAGIQLYGVGRKRPLLPVMVGDDLQFLYSSACYAGTAADLWAARVAPARIMMYDRKSGGLEHFLWLLFEAPQCVREVH